MPIYVSGKPPIDDFRTVAHIKTLVHQIYSAMNIEQHQVRKKHPFPLLQLWQLNLPQFFFIFVYLSS